MAELGIDSIITRWQDEAETELNLVIGYTDHQIKHQSEELQTMVTEAWLFSYPTADIAVTNLGGLRAPIPPGEITLADIVGVMPFDNTIIEVQLSGVQLFDVILQGGRPVIGGLYQEAGQWILDKTGQPIEADATYSVLVNSFMYAGGDGYTLLAEYDPNGYDTAIHYRQPLIDWIIAQESSEAAPLP
jgi:2',3'-cyclic-nucleotide 2'-phosphodiesterase (5'-nucleotidase family)